MIDGKHLAADIDEHGVRIAFRLRRLGTEPGWIKRRMASARAVRLGC